MKKDRENGRIGYLFILAAGILWGFIGLFVKQLEANGSTPETTAFLRMACAFLLYLPLCAAGAGPGSLRIKWKELLFCAAQGLVCYGLFNMMYSRAVTMVGVSVGAVLLYTAPVFTLFFSVLLFREPFTSRKLLAVLLNILGCALTATGGRLEPGALSVAGILTGIGAGFCYSLTPVFGHFGTKRMDSRVMTLYSFLFAALFLFLRLRPWNGGAAFSGKILLWGALFALIPTVLAYVLYYRGLSRIPEPSRVPVIASVETVVAAAVGMALYHDRLGLWGILGILLVLVSIGVMNLPDPKKQGKTGQITGK